MLQDFYQPRICASGVMAWTPGPHTDAIYHAACKLTRLPGGRSDYWYARVAPKPDRLQSLYPGQIVSYKAHARAGIPENARLVCYHGKPRPNDPNAGWGYHEWGKMAYAPASQASA
jgi:hypothetical protein